MTATPRLGVAPWLREGALARLLEVLDGDGEEARVVGGAVRNSLLGEPFNEVDVATTALPPDVIRRVKAAGFKPVPTGIDHGTVTVLVDGRPFEVTTLRKDVETFGRHARVVFGRDWRADAERRDFTINALSLSADGTVHDYVGGIADLKARRVRFIGDPDRRIAEDYLRILRFFRFHAAYGHGVLDEAGLHACIGGRAGLAQLSRERVRMELMKLLQAPLATQTLGAMSDAGLLLPILGGIGYPASFARMVEIEAALELPSDAVQRLGVLGVYVIEDAERLWQRLRLSNEEHRRLVGIGDGWWRVVPGDARQGRSMLYRFGPERFLDCVLVAWSRSRAGATDTAWRDLATLPQRWSVPKFPLKAADFINRGIAKGPALGAALRAAEETWIAADFPVERPAINAIADAAATNCGP